MNWNIDIKDLFAKLKGGRSGGKKGGGITSFFEKNPKMKIILPVILLVISLAVALVIIFTTGSTDIDTSPVGASGEGAQVDILPDDVREIEDIDLNGEDVIGKADLARAKLTTIIVNSEGYYTAVVETESYSYSTLQVGDYLGDSWLVENIDDTSITLCCDDEKVVLEIEK